MDDEKTIKIQRLKGASNYRIWSAEISAHLAGKGLMGVTLGKEPKPDGLNKPHSNTQTVGTTKGSPSGVKSGSIEAMSDRMVHVRHSFSHNHVDSSMGSSRREFTLLSSKLCSEQGSNRTHTQRCDFSSFLTFTSMYVHRN